MFLQTQHRLVIAYYALTQFQSIDDQFQLLCSPLRRDSFKFFLFSLMTEPISVFSIQFESFSQTFLSSFNQSDNPVSALLFIPFIVFCPIRFLDLNIPGLLMDAKFKRRIPWFYMMISITATTTPIVMQALTALELQPPFTGSSTGFVWEDAADVLLGDDDVDDGVGDDDGWYSGLGWLYNWLTSVGVNATW